MKKTFIFLLFAVLCIVGTTNAQEVQSATSFSSAVDSGSFVSSTTAASVQNSTIVGVRGVESIVYYADRASFQGACSGTLVLEDLAGGPGVLEPCAQSIDEDGNNCYAPGEIQPGIQISSSDQFGNPKGDTIYAPAGFSVNVDDMVGSDAFSDYTVINFPNGDVNSLGLDFHGLPAAVAVDVRVFGTGGLLETVTITTGLPGPVFFGFIATETIVSVEFQTITGGAAELVAQIEFGTCSPSASVANNTIKGFEFYPNPSSDVINLRALNNIDVVEVYSVMGQKVSSQSFNANQGELNISNLSTGIYVMKVTVSDEVASYQIIKK